MARIRSVHPSLFTDERWIACSPLARLLYIGLLTEADDQGLFEWKPIQIKVRLLPLDNADVRALLDELSEIDLIAKLQSAGKQLGAVRKFRRFQRPKKPNSIFVLPPEFRAYVGLGEEPGDDEAPPVPHQFPTGGEEREQKEDGGDKMEEEETSVSKEDARRALVPFSDDIAEALSAYNAVASEVGLPLARTLTDARRKHLRARLVEHGLDGWRAAMDGLRAPFCCGENGRGWRANLDFALQAASCAKLTENAYATGSRSPPMTPGMVAAASDEWAYREAIRRAEERDGSERNNQRDQGVVVALPAPSAQPSGPIALAGGLRR